MDSMKALEKTFTKSELKIYRLILKDPHSIEKYSITRIAVLTDTSKSAVLRFCKKLGFSGYSEFKFMYIQQLHANKGNDGQDTNLISEIVDDFSTMVTQLKNALSEEQLMNLAKALYKAPIIRVIGLMDSSIPCKKLQLDFIKLGKNVLLVDNVIEADASVASISNSDILIFFSVSGRVGELKSYINSAKKRAATIIAITCNEHSQIARLSDQSFVIPSARINTFYSLDEHSLMMIFVNILREYYKRMLAES